MRKKTSISTSNKYPTSMREASKIYRPRPKIIFPMSMSVLSVSSISYKHTRRKKFKSTPISRKYNKKLSPWSMTSMPTMTIWMCSGRLSPSTRMEWSNRTWSWSKIWRRMPKITRRKWYLRRSDRIRRRTINLNTDCWFCRRSWAGLGKRGTI